MYKCDYAPRKKAGYKIGFTINRGTDDSLENLFY